MVEGSDGAVLRQVGRLLRGEGTAGLSDGQLLERFATRADEGAEVAFEAILRRHGPMVLGVCRRVLRDPHAADDAFQATFLVLARKARSVRVESSLGHWLYGVTYRIAVRARVQADRRRAREGGDPDLIPSPPDDDVDRRDLDAAIHEEVARLPEKYRRPIVLCYLEGRSHEAAAEALRWPIGTVRGRLARARDLLRRRLSRRGLAPSAGMIGACLAARGARAGVPAPLLENTVAAAARVAAGRLVAAGMVSATAAALSEGALRTMTVAKLKWAFAGVVALGIAGGAGARAYQGLGHGPGPGSSPIQLAQAKGEERKEAPRPEAEKPAEIPKTAEVPPRAEIPSPGPDASPLPAAGDPKAETPTLPGPFVANEPPPLPQPQPESKLAEPPLRSPQRDELPGTIEPKPVPEAQAIQQPEPPNVGQASQNLVQVKDGLSKRIAVLERQSKDLRSQADAAENELKSARAMLDAIDRVLQPADARAEGLQNAGSMATMMRPMAQPSLPPRKPAEPPATPRTAEAPRVAKRGDTLDVTYPNPPNGDKHVTVPVAPAGTIVLDSDIISVLDLTAEEIKERIVHLLLFKRGMSEEDLGLHIYGDGDGIRVPPRATGRVRVRFGRALQPADARAEAPRKAGFMPQDPNAQPGAPPRKLFHPLSVPKAVEEPKAMEAPRVAAPGDLLDLLYPADAETEKRQRVQVDASGAIHLENDTVPVAGMTALDIKERIVHMLLFKRGLTEERLGLTANRPGSRIRPRDTFRVRVSFVVPPQDDPEPRIRALEDKLDRVIEELKALKPASPQAPRAVPGTGVGDRPQTYRIEDSVPRTGDSPREMARVAKPGDLLDITIPSTNPKGDQHLRIKVGPYGVIRLGEDNLSVLGMTAVAIKERIVNLLLFKRGMSDEDLGLLHPGADNAPPIRVHPRDAERVRVLFVHVVPPSTDDRIKGLEGKLDRLIDELKAQKQPAAGERRAELPPDEEERQTTYSIEGDVFPGGVFPVRGKSVVEALEEAAGPGPFPEGWRVRLVRHVDAGPSRPTEQTLPVDLAAIAKGKTSTNYALQPGDRLVVSRVRGAKNEAAEPSEPTETLPEARDTAHPIGVEDRLRDVEQKLDFFIESMTAEPEEPRPGAVRRFFEMLLGPTVPAPLPHYAAQPQRRVEQMLINSEDLHQADDQWNRFWILDQPSKLTPFRTHGGLGP